MAKKMAPRLYWNQLRHGRALDLLVTHTPPRDVNDRPDPAHRGFETFRGFLEQWRPAYHLHGHVHLYDRSQPSEQIFADTKVINVFPYRLLELNMVPEASRTGGSDRAMSRPFETEVRHGLRASATTRLPRRSARALCPSSA